VATAWLFCKGYRVLARNVRYRGGELDMVARQRRFYVFVEVKYRSSDRFGRSDEFVDGHKQRRLKTAALAYMRQNGINPEAVDWRFDVIAIQGFRLRHIRNAFS